MVVNVVLLQNPAPVVIEIDADLLATVYAIPSQCWLTARCDPHACQRIGVDLVTLDDAKPVVMLKEGKSAKHKYFTIATGGILLIVTIFEKYLNYTFVLVHLVMSLLKFEYFTRFLIFVARIITSKLATCANY